MLRFLESATDTSTALSGSYDTVPVVVSYLVAALAAYAGLLMSERISAAKDARSRWMWLGAGALTMGIGVWSMHFLAMLAFALPIPVDYDLKITIASAVPAILANAIVLYVMARSRRRYWQYIIAGVVLGVGIGVMHFTGMAAMQLDADMLYDPTRFALSIAVAVGLGIVALYAHDLRQVMSSFGKGILLRPFGAALMGLAITGMHYTAMAATYYFPAAEKDFDHHALSPFWLSVGVSVITILIVLLAIAATVVDKKLQSTTQLMRVTRQRMIEAIESISDGFIIFDGGGRLVMCNNMFRRMYPSMDEILQPGVSYERVLKAWANIRTRFREGMSAQDYVAQCLRRFAEGRAIRDDPEEEQLQDGRWVYIRQRSVDSGGLVGVWTDVSSIKELQTLYENQAHHDTLTGLPNRQLFDDRLDHAVAHAKRLNGTVALLYVDLDGFKPINDTLGHAAGDIVLIEVAKRLQLAVRETDTVARLGGDEFAVILSPQGDRESAEMAATRILQSLSTPISVGDGDCTVAASIGIGISPAQYLDKVAFVKKADAAMYEAKNAGGNSYRVDAS